MNPFGVASLRIILWSILNSRSYLLFLCCLKRRDINCANLDVLEQPTPTSPMLTQILTVNPFFRENMYKQIIQNSSMPAAMLPDTNFTFLFKIIISCINPYSYYTQQPFHKIFTSFLWMFEEFSTFENTISTRVFAFYLYPDSQLF